MSLLLRVIKAAHCRSTHHFMAIDSLSSLRCELAEEWSKVFLHHYDSYLSGAKAPDTDFKDFRNHVLHVSQDYWGGAVAATRKWYDKSLQHFKRGHFAEGVYAAGVMTHYYTDPIQPFHTGQSEAESNIHRAAEWSITKSYEELCEVKAKTSGLPKVEVPHGKDWLEEMVRQGADYSHVYYQTLIDEYDFRAGKSNPPAGLNNTSRQILAKLIHFATEGTARILEVLLKESGVAPPSTTLTLATFVASLEMPIRYVTKKMGDIEERKAVEAMYEEFHRTGKVTKMLPLEQRAIKKLVDKELGGDGAPAGSRPTQSATGPVERPVEEAAHLRGNRRADSAEISKPSIASHQESETQPEETVGNRSPEATLAELRKKFGGRPRIARTEDAKPKVNPPRQSQTEPEKVQSDLRQHVETKPDASPEPKRTAVPTEFAQSGGSSQTQNSRRLSKKERKRLARQQQQSGQKSGPTFTKANTNEPASNAPQLTLGQSRDHQFQPNSQQRKNESSSAHAEQNDESAKHLQPSDRQPSQLRFYLQAADEIEDAPSIGPKTGARLRKVGISTVAQLLAADVDETARAINAKHIRAATLADWQDQARLVCRIPQIRGHDAQILVACDYRSAEAVALAAVDTLYAQALEFADSSEGVRVLRGSNAPDKAEIAERINWARQSRSLKAA
jgi:predicted flap endonuclease-1-like 5' DNA nuclease